MIANITAKILNANNNNYIAQCSLSSGFNSIVATSQPIIPDEFSLAKFKIENLNLNTKYFVRVANTNGEPIDNYVGSFKTLNTGVYSFKFGFASCSWSNSTSASNNRIYDNIANKAVNNQLDFFFHLGDMFYRDIAVNNENLFQQAYDDVFEAPRQNNCWKNLPMYYMWDDHDYGPNDSDKNSPSRLAAISAYRRRVPYPPLAKSELTESPYYSFVCGRSRFIVTDIRSERETKGTFPSTDSRQKVFSEDQKNWFFQEMLSAKANGQIIIWINTKPWISSIENGKDDWGGYHAARLEIVNFITENNLQDRIVILSGDMHALAYDDGSSINNYGSLKVCHGAPLDQESRPKGGPYTIGPITDDAGTGWSTQYGIIEIIDNGGNLINVRFKGVVISKIDFSESTPIDVNFNLNCSAEQLSIELTKAFIPIIGDDDYKNSNQFSNNFESYFPVMGNKILNNTSNKNKYYDFYVNNSHFIILDTEPICGGVYSDGNPVNFAGIGQSGLSNSIYESEQKTWFNNTIANSTGKYKFVFASRPPFASTTYSLTEAGLGPYGYIFYKGSTKFNPFNGWKLHLADAVYGGFSRAFEKIEFDFADKTLLGNQGKISSSGLPPYIQITKNNDVLKIDYGISGYDPNYGSIAENISNGLGVFMTHNFATGSNNTITGDGVKFTNFSVFIRTPQGNFNSFQMISSGSGFTYNYTVPLNTDYINLYFRNNSNNRIDSNSYDFDTFNYIYYINNDNNFGRTQYLNIGNVLKNVSPTSNTYSNSKLINSANFGYVHTQVFNSGIRYRVYYYNYLNENNLKPEFLIIDETAKGVTQGPITFEFATIANFGMTYNPISNIFNINQGGIFERKDNSYVAILSEEIKNKNIDYIFGVGNMNYHPTGMFYTGVVGNNYITLYPPSFLFDRTSGVTGLTPINNSLAPYNIDQSVGAFFFNHLPCYRGAYTGIIKSGLYNVSNQLFAVEYKTLFDPQKAISGITNLNAVCNNSKFKFIFTGISSSSSSFSSSSSSSSFRYINSFYFTSGADPTGACLSSDFNVYFYEGPLDVGTNLYKDTSGTIPVDNAWYRASFGDSELGNQRIFQTNNGIIINNNFSCDDFISSSSSSFSSSSSSSSSSSLSSSSSSSSGVSSSSSSVSTTIDLEFIRVISPSF